MARRVYFPFADLSIDPDQVSKVKVTGRNTGGFIVTATMYMQPENLSLTDAGDIQIMADEFTELRNPKP